MRHLRLPLVALIAIALLLSGCIVPIGTSPTAPTWTVAAPNTPVVPTQTPRPITPTPQFTATPQIFEPLVADVNVASVNMRSGPSVLFDIAARYGQGSQLQVIARAPGNAWVFVRGPDSKSGWAAVDFIEIQGDLNTLPYLADPQAAQAYIRVVDGSGEPVEGVNLALISGNLRADAYSDASGDAYIFVPLAQAGEWELNYLGVLCSSRIANADCTFTGSFTNVGAAIQVPSAEPVVMVYTP